MYCVPFIYVLMLTCLNMNCLFFVIIKIIIQAKITMKFEWSIWIVHLFVLSMQLVIRVCIVEHAELTSRCPACGFGQKEVQFYYLLLSFSLECYCSITSKMCSSKLTCCSSLVYYSISTCGSMFLL